VCRKIGKKKPIGALIDSAEAVYEHFPSSILNVYQKLSDMVDLDQSLLEDGFSSWHIFRRLETFVHIFSLWAWAWDCKWRSKSYYFNLQIKLDSSNKKFWSKRWMIVHSPVRIGIFIRYFAKAKLEIFTQNCIIFHLLFPFLFCFLDQESGCYNAKRKTHVLTFNLNV